jgi:monoamine oxidase
MDLRGAELHSVQKDALRELHYDASCKVAIEFATPWRVVKGGITSGGTASTDSSIRTCVYPSYNLHDGATNPAVLLCSYTWAQAAQRIGSLISDENPGKDDQLLELVLLDLVRLHPYMTYEELKESVMQYHSYDWYSNTNASGAFALFAPGQFSRLYPLLCRPTANGNLHFVEKGRIFPTSSRSRLANICAKLLAHIMPGLPAPSTLPGTPFSTS